MSWSGLRKKLLRLFVPEAAEAVQVHLTSYGRAASEGGRGWITLHGRELVSVSDSDTGRLTRQCLYEAVCSYPHKSVEELVGSENPFEQAFLCLDRRVGRRRLEKLRALPEGDAWVRELLDFRLSLKKQLPTE